MQFPWLWESGTIYTNLDVICGISGENFSTFYFPRFSQRGSLELGVALRARDNRRKSQHGKRSSDFPFIGNDYFSHRVLPCERKAVPYFVYKLGSVLHKFLFAGDRPS